MNPNERADFIRALLSADMSRAEQFIGMLWFDTNNAHGDADPGALLLELEHAGMARQNRRRILEQARKSRWMVSGRGVGKVRLATRFAQEMEMKYQPLCSAPRAPRVVTEFLPKTMIPSSRTAWVELCAEANGCYSVGYYDGAAVLYRRIVEALLIEVYVSAGRESEIKNGPAYLMLDPLISYFEKDAAWTNRSRNLVPDLRAVKAVGDTAAHHRFHITQRARR